MYLSQSIILNKYGFREVNVQEEGLLIENSKKEGLNARYLKLMATLAQSN